RWRSGLGGADDRSAPRRRETSLRSRQGRVFLQRGRGCSDPGCRRRDRVRCASPDRKSTRLNSSHEWISYAVFCLKKRISGRTSAFLSLHLRFSVPLLDRRAPLVRWAASPRVGVLVARHSALRRVVSSGCILLMSI